ncbi:MAG: HMA2 domain-containing protein [Syntrophobacteraceae bacterium]
MGVYVHEVPGRLRVKSSLIKGNLYKARELEQIASDIPGVSSATANPTTGSIVVQYNPAMLGSETLLSAFADSGVLDRAQAASSLQPYDRGIEKTGQFLGKALLALAIEKVFEGTPLALLTVVL